MTKMKLSNIKYSLLCTFLLSLQVAADRRDRRDDHDNRDNVPAQISCPKGFKLFGQDLCLRIATSDRRWDEAVQRCINYGGKLFEPRSKEEVEIVRPNLAKGLYWLGISDAKFEGIFRYNSTNTAITFSDWRENNPRRGGAGGAKEDCVAYFNLKEPGSRTWKNMKCKIRHRYICQADAINSCFEKNVLYFPERFITPTVDACIETCKSVSSCQFINYSPIPCYCELGSYLPSNFVRYNNMATATRTFKLPYSFNSAMAFVGASFVLNDEYECQNSCQRDEKCESFAYWEDRTQNPKLCVHNYFETAEKRDIKDQDTKIRKHYSTNYVEGQTVYTSGPKFCGSNVPVIDNEAKL